MSATYPFDVHVPDPWVEKMRAMPTTVISTTLDGNIQELTYRPTLHR